MRAIKKIQVFVGDICHGNTVAEVVVVGSVTIAVLIVFAIVINRVFKVHQFHEKRKQHHNHH